MKLYWKILFFWMAVVLSAYGQSDLLKGKLVDASTIEPVAFATIRVKGRAVGVISNADGSFQVPQKFKAYGDMLQISSMGYGKREILISTFPVDDPRRIYLQPAVFELEEAIVKAKKKRSLSARKIIQRAIGNIPKNYPFQPFSTVGYYRDYQLKENKYVNLNEAILEVFDKGFSKIDSSTTKVRIYECKQNTEFKRDSLASDFYDYKSRKKIINDAYLFSYHGNEFTILRVHDAIRNYNLDSFSYIYRLDKDLLDNHTFTKDGSVSYNDIPLYKIRFQKRIRNYRALGTIYISHGDFEIHKLEYSVYNLKTKSEPKESWNNQESGEPIFKVVTEYQKMVNKMYLNYISFRNRFQLLKPMEFRVIDVIWDRDVNRFEVLLNKEAIKKSALEEDNYIIEYKGHGIKFRALEYDEFSKRILLYPKMSSKKDREAIAEIRRLSQIDQPEIGVLTIEIKNIRDRDGNLINERSYEPIEQFREYFVQQVNTSVVPSNNAKFMNDRQPIFKDQPIARPGNFDDYWMNTPLKTIE